MLGMVHLISAAGGIVATLVFLASIVAARECLEPDRTVGERVRFWFFPQFDVRSDYTDEGWAFVRRKRLAWRWMIACGVVFVLTG
jgi:hypothetical protein